MAALKEKYKLVSDNSRVIAVHYLDMTLGHTYPETRRKGCAQCLIVNGNAWDVTMWQVGARKERPRIGLEQSCDDHPNIIFDERVKIARDLDDTLLYQRYEGPKDD